MKRVKIPGSTKSKKYLLIILIFIAILVIVKFKLDNKQIDHIDLNNGGFSIEQGN